MRVVVDRRMKWKEYKFDEFTDKDMFECKLQAVIPHFGYISSKNRREFIKFLVEHKFVCLKNITNLPKTTTGYYTVLENFQYTELNDYSPLTREFGTDDYILTNKSWKLIRVAKSDEIIF